MWYETNAVTVWSGHKSAVSKKQKNKNKTTKEEGKDAPFVQRDNSGTVFKALTEGLCVKTGCHSDRAVGGCGGVQRWSLGIGPPAN